MSYGLYNNLDEPHKNNVELKKMIQKNTYCITFNEQIQNKTKTPKSTFQKLWNADD